METFDHRAHSRLRRELQRILRVLDVPAGHPAIVRCALINWNNETAKGSALAPTITNLPRAPRPSTSAPIAFGSGAVARITAAPPSFLQFRRHVLPPAIDILSRTELQRQRLFVFAASDRDYVVTGFRRKLDTQMPKSAIPSIPRGRPAPRHYDAVR